MKHPAIRSLLGFRLDDSHVPTFWHLVYLERTWGTQGNYLFRAEMSFVNEPAVDFAAALGQVQTALEPRMLMLHPA